jgi:hypothetical protein
MPDRRKHRGPHPQDHELFADDKRPLLLSAVADLSWLLERDYPADAALKLVGDRYRLKQRQRTAVAHSACSYRTAARRRQKLVSLARAGGTIAIDGFNLLITMETALSGGLLLIGGDGCYRDLASVWGSYRKIEETTAAIAVIRDFIGSTGVARVQWYLDRPVSNSGRLKSLIGEALTPDNQWQIDLVANPDPILAKHQCPVATSDSWILDRCRTWVNLAAEIIDQAVPEAWKLDLRAPEIS